MLNKNTENRRKQISFLCIEDVVPKNHLLRDIEKAIDFSFIYDLVKDKYSEDTGRPSIDPVVLFKIVFIQYLFGIRSMRQTIKEIEVNNAYRWFLGYGFNEDIPHFTTFGKNYARRFAGTDVFEQIFEKILMEAVRCKFVEPSAIFIDATHIKASANKKKNVKEQVRIEAKHYHDELLEEIQKDRSEHNKKPLKDKHHDDDDPPTKAITKSTTDPESGLFHKGEHQKCFAYTAHVACDRNNFILGAEVSPGNIHDSVMFDSIYNQVKERFEEISAVVVDAGYKTPYICKQIIDDLKQPIMPYKRPMGKKGNFKPYEFVYDEYYNCVICPNNEVLKYSTTNRDGYKEFKSNPKICKNCPYLEQCTQSSAHTKIVTRHVWADYIEIAEDIRHTPEGKELYSQRGQTIERVFADAKEKHFMRYTQLRGLAKLKMQVMLTFACMNLKKLAKWKRLNPDFYCFLSKIYNFALLIKEKTILIGV